jgi:hypothetical protein
MDVREMKAGRELDALVAEKVMGVTFFIDNGELFIFEDGLSGFSIIFNPSTNISDAWKVVEKMRKLSYFIRLADQEEFIRVRFYNPDFLPVEKPSWVVAETVPLAICHAALLQMEG